MNNHKTFVMFCAQRLATGNSTALNWSTFFINGDGDNVWKDIMIELLPLLQEVLDEE